MAQIPPRSRRSFRTGLPAQTCGAISVEIVITGVDTPGRKVGDFYELAPIHRTVGSLVRAFRSRSLPDGTRVFRARPPRHRAPSARIVSVNQMDLLLCSESVCLRAVV